MSTHTYAYRVGRLGFDWKGQRLHLGDVLRGDDARELEDPENEHLKQRCARVRDSFFAHHDTPDEDDEVPTSPPALSLVPSRSSSLDVAAATEAKE